MSCFFSVKHGHYSAHPAELQAKEVGRTEKKKEKKNMSSNNEKACSQRIRHPRNDIQGEISNFPTA